MNQQDVSHLVGDRVTIVTADITTLAVDVIVNAANASLLGGGGVDGAIHRAAGPELLVECRGLAGASTGDVAVTGAYRLPAQVVAHAVGPIWRGGGEGEDAALASCYRSALAVMADRRLSSIAFPSISTGAYGFPFERAAAIAVGEVGAFLRDRPGRFHVVFCCFSETDAERIRVAAEAYPG